MIHFSCSGCEKSFKVKDELGGKRTKCPDCGISLRVPSAKVSIATLPRSRRTDRSAEEARNCDVCSKFDCIKNPNGHLLTTREVVTALPYWRMLYEKHSAAIAYYLGISSFSEYRHIAFMRTGWPMSGMLPRSPSQLADSKTPWLVCSECVAMFNVDVESAQEHARRWWKNRNYRPPGNGPISISEVRKQLGVTVLGMILWWPIHYIKRMIRMVIGNGA